MSARTPVGAMVERTGDGRGPDPFDAPDEDVIRVSGAELARAERAYERRDEMWVCEICGAENDSDVCLFCVTAEEEAMRGTIVTKTIEIRPEPAEVARHFAAAGSVEQAETLHEIARAFPSAAMNGGASYQALALHLSPAAVQWMRAVVATREEGEREREAGPTKLAPSERGAA